MDDGRLCLEGDYDGRGGVNEQEKEARTIET